MRESRAQSGGEGQWEKEDPHTTIQGPTYKGRIAESKDSEPATPSAPPSSAAT